MTFLDDILASTREAVRASRLNRPSADLKRRIRDREKPRPFAAALSEGSGPRLIAELKQASPSQGILRTRFDPVEIARIYEDEGAAALSVLTEERFFRGSLDNLERVRAAVKRPLLRKDFIIDEYQVYESRAFDADAVLLIAAILDDSRLKDFRMLAADLGMDSLVEVHTEAETERALRAGAGLVGINNRDLATFKTDLETTFRLIRGVPEDWIVVSESGIARRADVERLKEAGVDAVLIGETFMKSPDIRGKIRELFGKVDNG
ncbi:MAG TPA: indole-3-glycerol phosphate synthase TrpC [Planctomycetota bacterium]|nr:indole-3-glycerol phosphate synthase TrpC [Planctomycetota bacterium]